MGCAQSTPVKDSIQAKEEMEQHVSVVEEKSQSVQGQQEPTLMAGEDKQPTQEQEATPEAMDFMVAEDVVVVAEKAAKVKLEKTSEHIAEETAEEVVATETSLDEAEPTPEVAHVFSAEDVVVPLLAELIAESLAQHATVAVTLKEVAEPDTEPAAEVSEEAAEVIAPVPESVAEEPVEDVANPVVEVTEEAVEDAAEVIAELVEEIVTVVAQPLAEEPVEEVTEPATEVTEEAAEGPVVAVTDEVVEVENPELTEEPVQVVAEPVVDEVVEEAAEPVAEVTEEASEKSAADSAEDAEQNVPVTEPSSEPPTIDFAKSSETVSNVELDSQMTDGIPFSKQSSLAPNSGELYIDRVEVLNEIASAIKIVHDDTQSSAAGISTTTGGERSLPPIFDKQEVKFSIVYTSLEHGIVYYHIQMLIDGVSVWKQPLKKRYNDFKSLHQQLSSLSARKVHDLPPLPTSSAFSYLMMARDEPKMIATRSKRFELLLFFIWRDQQLQQSKLVQDFLMH